MIKKEKRGRRREGGGRGGREREREKEREGRQLGLATHAGRERRQQKASRRTEGRVPPSRRGGRHRGEAAAEREKVEVIIPMEQWPHDLAYASRSMSHGH